MEEKYYSQIKEKIIDTELTIKVKDYSKNKVILDNYYEIGRLLVEAQGGEERAKYGDQLIKKYSEKLTIDLNKKYSVTTLKYMRKFYLYQKGQPMADQLSWSHWIELLSLKSQNEVNYYITLTIKNSLSRNELRKRIKSNEYENLSEDTRKKLIDNKKPELIELIKDPIVIPNYNNIEVVKEKILQKLIMENIYSFLKQLGIVLINSNYVHINDEDVVFDKDCKVKISIYFNRTHTSIDYTPTYKLLLNGTEISSGNSPRSNTTDTSSTATVTVDAKKDDVLYLNLFGGGTGAAVITVYMEVTE